MAVRPRRRASRAEPAADAPRVAAPRPTGAPGPRATGRWAGLAVAGTGIYWVLAMWAGDALDLSQRVRALLDLFALAGFGLALFLTYQAWRARRPAAE